MESMVTESRTGVLVSLAKAVLTHADYQEALVTVSPYTAQEASGQYVT